MKLIEKIYLNFKIIKTCAILFATLVRFPRDFVAVAWTGGKDSTIILWFVREIVTKLGWKMPKVMTINEGDVFLEVRHFMSRIEKLWGLDIHEVANKDVLKQVKSIGDKIQVHRLDKRNQKELHRLGYDGKEFSFQPESLLGNHLMKTVAMNRYLEKTKYRAIITGIRWDEQESRSAESYFSKRGDEHTPYHVRIHPILHFTEKEIWQVIQKFNIPFCSLYKRGYRSLGAKGTTKRSTSKPAWAQDLSRTSERSGRQQDKERIMEKLRDLGYM